MKKSSKAGKKQKNLYLSLHGRKLLASLSFTMGISETAVVELLVREKAGLQSVVVPSSAVIKNRRIIRT